MNKKLNLKKETFKIGDIVNVRTIINGLNYNLNVKVISDILNLFHECTSAPSKPRP